VPITTGASPLRHELRGQGNLGDEDERLQTLFDHALDRTQVDLGLAAASDPMQQELLKPAGRRADGGDRVLLRGAQVRSARGLDERSRADRVLDAQFRHPAAPFELAQVFAPARRERHKLGFTGVAAYFERAHHLA